MVSPTGWGGFISGLWATGTTQGACCLHLQVKGALFICQQADQERPRLSAGGVPQALNGGHLQGMCGGVAVHQVNQNLNALRMVCQF